MRHSVSKALIAMDGVKELEFRVSHPASSRRASGFSCSQKTESWVRGPTQHRNRSGTLYFTMEQVRGPLFFTGAGQRPYIPHRNRSGALYPTPEQVRSPVSPLEQVRDPILQRNRSGALYPTPEQVRSPVSPLEQVRDPILQRNRSGALYPTPEQVRGPISHRHRSGTLNATPEQIRHLMPHWTGQSPELSHRNSLGALYPTGTGQGPCFTKALPKSCKWSWALFYSRTEGGPIHAGTDQSPGTGQMPFMSHLNRSLGKTYA